MTCQSCAERRQAVMRAWQEGKIAEAVKQAAIGAAELTGLKAKGCAHEFLRQQPNEYGDYVYECPDCGASGTRPTPWSEGLPL